uniref:LOB domain-containing protein n=1 Tax=Chenopodium quinoa TaxID=63459 RepID=A0A803LI28_CHEQI
MDSWFRGMGEWRGRGREGGGWRVGKGRGVVAGCVFAPYFDSEQGTAHFAAVHKVFGASNASKLLLRIPAHRRLDAVVTLCYEALSRVRDPVYGCVAHIFTLQQQVLNMQAELAFVQARLSTLQRLPAAFPAVDQTPSHCCLDQISASSAIATTTSTRTFVAMFLADLLRLTPTPLPLLEAVFFDLNPSGLDLPFFTRADGGGGGGTSVSSLTEFRRSMLQLCFFVARDFKVSVLVNFRRTGEKLWKNKNRLATPVEIRSVTPVEVLKSWRSVWKDRNEDTAYLTAWKRIQDKLNAHIDGNGIRYLCFKNNSNQFVSHISQWQEIVMSSHSDSDLKHLGLRETVDKIKQLWTVGAKFYGIPESFIRVCIASCNVCAGVSDGGGGGGGGFSGGRPKRRRFEYTESFDVPAKEVPNKLQQLAKKHKVVLCIRQKYIRYKPFMAEVKDYACHRAGEPASSKKNSKVLKREPYASKRCGCGFRIRAIVPITNYNEKDKTFVYQEEGMAVFKLYAVHTGHEPGPLDGNARIMHRVVGHKGVFLNDQETEYGVNEELDNDSFMGRDESDFGHAVLQQAQELKSEVGLLESRILKLPQELLDSVSQELYHIVNKVRALGFETSKSVGLDSDKHNSDVMLVGEGDLPHWSDPHDDRLYGDGKDTDLIEEDEDCFGRTLGDVVRWEPMRTDCRSDKDLISESCKPDKWLDTSEFDEKSILSCNSKLTKPMRHDSLDEDVGLVGLQVDSFYPENPKWYDSPCGLDSSTDCGDSEFRHGEIM